MKISLIIVSILVLTILCSCSLQPETTGRLSLNFTEQVSTKTLLPDTDMTIASYQVALKHANGTVLERSTSANQITFEKLEFGEWHIQVSAVNSTGLNIGQGANSTVVHTGETANVNVIVRPLEGTGSLELSLDWNQAEIDKPSIAAELIPPLGDPLPLAFQLTGDNAGTHSSINIPTGYYILALQLKDNDLLTMGAVEVVRIINGQTTKGSFHFSKLNKPGGNLIVNITPEMQEPIPVTISGQREKIRPKDELKLSAIVPAETGNTICIWYCNSEPVATGASCTLQNLALGNYRIDATVFSQDGTRAGSSNFMVQVVESLPLVTLTVESNDYYGTVTPAGSKEVPLNQVITICATAQRDWIHFDHWEISGEGVELVDPYEINSLVMDVILTKGAATVRAIFKSSGFDVYYQTVDTYFGSSWQLKIYTQPTSIPLTCTTFEIPYVDGYFIFKQWSCCGDITIDDPDAANTVANINGRGTIVLELEYRHKSQLTIEDVGGGENMYSLSYFKYPYTRYEITAYPYREAFKFKQWIAVSGNPEIEDPQSATTGAILTEDTVIQAVFEPTDISLNIVSSGSGSGQTNPSGIVITHYGDILSIKAIPAAGSKFVQWIIDDTASDLIIDDPNASETNVTVHLWVKVDQIREIKAIFETEQ